MEVRLIKQKGASAVEFAIILPILVLIVFGIIEFSVLLYDNAIVTNASREGARAGVLYRTDSDGAPNPLTREEVIQVVKDYLINYLISLGGSNTPTIDVDPAPASKQPRKVSVTYQYTFLVLKFISGPVLQAETIMRME